MKYCIKCNYKVNDDANYCGRCGNKLKWNTIEEHYDINTRVEKIRKLNYFDEELDRVIRQNEELLINSELYYKNNTCPYCGIILQKKLESTKKCPECGSKIIKRTNQYNKNYVLLRIEDISRFNNYDKQIRDIIKKDKRIESIMQSDIKYMDYFYELKSKGDLSVRDLIYSFCNHCAIKTESEALDIYNDAKDWKAAYAFNNMMHLALRNWDKLYEICIENGKTEIAIDLLAMMSYKNIISRYVFYELLDYKSGFDRNAASEFQYSGTIIRFLVDYSLKLDDFRKIFLEGRYSFLIFDKPKEFVWDYIYRAIIEHINYYKKFGQEYDIL